MDYMELKDLDFLKFVRNFYRLRMATNEEYDPPFHEAINYYANYLEQLTLDYWEDLLINYNIYNYHFQQSYQKINNSKQDIELKKFTNVQLFNLYDKLIEFYKLNIKSDFIIALSIWYPSIFSILSSQARKDLSDRRENLTLKYLSKELTNMQQKLKFEFSIHKIVDISHMLFYDVFFIQTLKQPMQAHHQLLDVIDDAFIQFFQEQYNLAEIQQNTQAKCLQITKKQQVDKEPLKKFKQDCLLTIMQMRMKNHEQYTKFIKHYLKL
ncbi:unnamed protein product (macronuclear) [Paramecium tetraurelia]|uniref:Cullin N-terminal domain-containing protein n=1 Tax=Paramecium tetraurelia TaxID=5888 RepID=A0BXG8_PARTE|nr:uncharacterized protein GSPATT00033088001 [Paramecium tetraurelia]CAK63235.1 unnamed protein product [Paramecium tetraurelia]|eukprot:XP_001430633.1 hypothetical protein (macronuclear) [Paramecium tetraurelia strain d4-2]